MSLTINLAKIITRETATCQELFYKITKNKNFFQNWCKNNTKYLKCGRFTHNIYLTNKFAIRVKELRLENNLTQKELADNFGFNRSTISDWETRGREPSYDLLIDVANFFDVSLDYLLGRTDI